MYVRMCITECKQVILCSNFLGGGSDSGLNLSNGVIIATACVITFIMTLFAA